MEAKFKVGDRVRAWGIDGVVQPSCTYSTDVLVLFDDGHNQHFDKEGKAQSWHKEPSLVLVERPKKKVKKTIERWVAFDPQNNCIDCTKSTKQEITRFVDGFKNNYQIVHLTGTYEVEVDDNE